MRVLRLIGIGGAAAAAAAAREWILVTGAAAAGGHRLALLETGIAAASYLGSHVVAAIVNFACGGCGRGRREESQRTKHRGGRGADFQNLVCRHLVLSVSVFLRSYESRSADGIPSIAVPSA